MTEKIDYFISEEQLVMMNDPDYQPLVFSQQSMMVDDQVGQGFLSGIDMSEMMSIHSPEQLQTEELTSYLQTDISDGVEQTLYDHKLEDYSAELHYGHIFNILQNVTDDAMHILVDEEVDII